MRPAQNATDAQLKGFLYDNSADTLMLPRQDDHLYQRWVRQDPFGRGLS